MPSFPRLTLAILILLPSAAGLSAQEKKERKPTATASLIPVGANSDAYWVGDGSNMRAIALDPGAAPPSTLMVRERSGFQTIPTILNRPSPPLYVAAGRLRLYEGPPSAGNEEPPVFADFKLPEPSSGHYDVFLSRALGRDDWKDAESLIVPGSDQVFPGGSLRLVNLSATSVKWKIAGAVSDLAPRRSRVVPRPAREENRLVAVQAAHAGDDGARIILRTGIRLGPDQRATLIVYSGRNPKKPCEVTWYYQSPDPEPRETPWDPSQHPHQAKP